jgi:hypothetical protein
MKKTGLLSTFYYGHRYWMVNHDWHPCDGSVHGRRHRIFTDEEEMTIREYSVTYCLHPQSCFTEEMFQAVATGSQRENGELPRSPESERGR